jgi:hypothetical protein
MATRNEAGARLGSMLGSSIFRPHNESVDPRPAEHARFFLVFYKRTAVIERHAEARASERGADFEHQMTARSASAAAPF